MITSVRKRIKVSERERNNDGGSNFWSLFILIFIIILFIYIILHTKIKRMGWHVALVIDYVVKYILTNKR